MISPSPLPPFRSNHTRAQIIVSLFGAFVLLDAIAIVALIAMINGLRLGAAASLDQLQVLHVTGQRLDVLGTIQIIAYIITSLAFVFWIYRAYQNLGALEAGLVDYSPRWAVGAFFVPVLNLVRPYQIVNEIWAKSEPHQAQLESSATLPTFWLTKVWWLSFILSNVVARLANTGLRSDPTLDELVMPMWLTLVSVGLQVVSAISGSLVIKSIDDRQEQRRRRLRALEGLPDAPRWNPALISVSIGLAILMVGVTLAQTPTALSITASAAPTASATPTPSDSVTPRPTLETTRRSSSTRPTATPHTGAYHLARSRRFLASGIYNMAATELSNAIHDDPNNPELYYLRGIANAHLDSPEAALRDFNTAIELDSEYAEAYYERGLVQLDLENYGLASKDFERALRLDPQYADAYIGSGWTHYLSEEYSAALVDIDRALDLDDKAVDAYHVRGLVYLDTGKFDEAVDDFTRALKLEPTSAVALNRRGLAFHARGDLTQALADFNEAIQLEPDFMDVYYNRGLVKADLGSYISAIEDFTRVIKKYPDWGPVYIERANIYGFQQQFDLAIADLEKALKLDLDAAARTDAEQMLNDFKAQRRGQSS